MVSIAIIVSILRFRFKLLSIEGSSICGPFFRFSSYVGSLCMRYRENDLYACELDDFLESFNTNVSVLDS